jgi:hypothetical protein
MAIGASPLLNELRGINAKKCQLDVHSADAEFHKAERTIPISNDVAFPSFVNIEDEAMYPPIENTELTDMNRPRVFTSQARTAWRWIFPICHVARPSHIEPTISSTASDRRLH